MKFIGPVAAAGLAALLARGADTATNAAAIFRAPPGPRAADAVDAEWPALLGPAGNMTSPETRLRPTFPPEGPPVVWELPKGEGFSPPAVAEGVLVLFHRLADEAVLDGLDPATGRRLWQFRRPTVYVDRYGYNGGPRAAPAIARGLVFALGVDGVLDALDLRTGRRRWSRDLAAEYRLQQNFFGLAASPLVEGDLVIVQVGAPDGRCVIALDAAGGRTVWEARSPWGQSYAAPVAATIAGRRRVLVFAGGESRPPVGGLLVLDPADGRVVASFPWRGKRYESVNAQPPLVLGDRAFLSECYGAGGVMLDLARDGEIRPRWTNTEFGLHFMLPVAKAGYLYGVDGHGPGDAYLTCLDEATGRTVWRVQPQWRETVETALGPREIRSGTFRGWLLPVDGRCLCLGEYGDLLWLDLHPAGFRELARGRLFHAAQTWSPPVLSRGLLYVCQNQRELVRGAGPRLLCLDLRDCRTAPP